MDSNDLTREWSGELIGGDAKYLDRERCARLSRLTGVDPRAIFWECGFVERVSTTLLATRVGADRLGRSTPRRGSGRRCRIVAVPCTKR